MPTWHIQNPEGTLAGSARPPVMRRLRWRRPYRDWRVWLLHPLILAIVTLAVYDGLTTDLPIRSAWMLPAMAGLFALLLWRMVRTGIYVSADAVRIRWLFSSTILRWDDISEIDDLFAYTDDLTIKFRTKGGLVVDSEVQQMNAARDGQAPMLPERSFRELIERLREMHRESTASVT